MPNELKADFWRELKAAGIKPSKPYVQYTKHELEMAVAELREQPGYVKPDLPKARVRGQVPAAKPVPTPPDEFDFASDIPEPSQAPQVQQVQQMTQQEGFQPIIEESPLRTDEEGRIWFREEVRKPATPQPRARRRITYIDSGVKQEQVIDGRYIETIEVAGDRQTRSEVRITMPSYQVGVYLDPRFPFKVHIYNEVRGFDLFDIQKFYGGSDLVPDDIQRMYVGNDLCYDVRSVIRSIQSEFRLQQLRGAIQ